jgi:uracil-DNA glycosylase family 4
MMTVQRKHPLAECERCPLASTGVYVPSDGPEKASLAIVGEAPGRQEAQGGKPFVGASGQLLTRVLKHHKIDRKKVFLSNACLCRPRNNDTPPAEAVAACRPRLVAELGAHGTRTVIALGNIANQSLISRTGVTKLRVGPGHPALYDPGVRVISSVHPAACLRQGDMFPHLVRDIGKVYIRPPVWKSPDYFALDTEEEALYFIHWLGRNHQGPVALDIESHIDREEADHPNKYGMLCIGLGYAHKRVAVLGEHALTERTYGLLGNVLRQKELIGQNSKFDAEGMYPHMGFIPFKYDTMLASYCFDERPGIHDLGTQSIEFLGAPDWKHVLDGYGAKQRGYGVVPRDVLYKYNAFDVSCTYDLWALYDQKFANPANDGLRRVHDLLMDASNELVFVELNGIAIDRAYNAALAREYLETLEQLEKELDDILQRRPGPYPQGANPRSPQQVAVVIRSYHIKLPIAEGKENPSVDEKTLRKVLELVQDKKGFEDVREYVTLLLRHRRESKLYGTYVKGIRQRLYRGRVYSSFRLHGTVTGRLASRNPNLQNIPRQSSIRRQFVPANEGWVFVQSDYSQAELRVLSFLAGDSYFRDIFNGGDRDLFDELTPIVYPGADKRTTDPAAWKELRIRIKARVYGLAYGRSEFSIADEFGIPVQQARAEMETFFGVIPEIVEFRERTRASVLAGRDLVTPWGRRRRFPLITKENRTDILNEALAFIPQSTASDMCLQAFTRARRELKGVAYLRNIVHDSILAECRREDAEYVAGVLDRCMVESARTIVGDYVAFATDYKVGTNWGEV